jgi:hypothetical protein
MNTYLKHYLLRALLAGALLPANTTITVDVTGTYNAQPFSHNWSFHTATTAQNNEPSQANLPPSADHSPPAHD